MDALKVAQWFNSHEEWLMLRMLDYAKKQGFTRYTSTLAEAWRMAVTGLSATLIEALATSPEPPELAADEDFTRDPMASFGILEARLHRHRGITLPMFLGMMKYCRQAYQDLAETAPFPESEKKTLRLYLDRMFDRIELGFCSEWSQQSQKDQLEQLQASNRQLTNEKNLYLTLFESLHAPVLFFSPDHQLVNLNHAANQLFSNPPKPGAAYYNAALPTAELSWLSQRIQELQAQCSETCCTTQIRVKDQFKHFQVRVKGMLDVSDKFIGTVVILEDVSVLKKAEDQTREAMDFYLQLFEDFPALIWRAGLDAKCNYFNRTWLEFTGRTMEQEAGDGWAEGVHPEDLEHCLQIYLESFAARRPFAMEYRLRHHSGEYRWLNDIGRPFFDLEGNFAGYIGSCYDITEAKSSQEQKNQLLQELQRSNQELEHFAYIASHDLQEPLRMITGYLQLLSRRYQGKLDQDAEEFIGFAVDGARRMEALIKDLLAFSRIERKGKPLQPVACSPILATVLNNLKTSLDESAALLSIGHLPTVQADPGQLTQLLQNLVHNAIKFRGEAPPRITIEAEPRGTDWEFSVRDNGIGIAPRHRERVFQIFQRLHPIGQYPGTGIGLAFCKKIVERHGGRIWVEGEEGEGTCIRFILPGAAERENAERANASLPQAS